MIGTLATPVRMLDLRPRLWQSFTNWLWSSRVLEWFPPKDKWHPDERLRWAWSHAVFVLQRAQWTGKPRRTETSWGWKAEDRNYNSEDLGALCTYILFVLSSPIFFDFLQQSWIFGYTLFTRNLKHLGMIIKNRLHFSYLPTNNRLTGNWNSPTKTFASLLIQIEMAHQHHLGSSSHWPGPGWWESGCSIPRMEFLLPRKL